MAQERLRTEEPLPALGTATRAPQIVKHLVHTGAPIATRAPQIVEHLVPTAAHLLAGGLWKQEMRDCKGIKILFSSVQFSRSVVSDSLQPHESQHARPPCPSPTPGVH